MAVKSWHLQRDPIETRFKNLLLLLPAIVAFAPQASAAPPEPPVKIDLMVGQSNMQGKGAVAGEGTNTLRHIVENDPENKFQSS